MSGLYDFGIFVHLEWTIVTVRVRCSHRLASLLRTQARNSSQTRALLLRARARSARQSMARLVRMLGHASVMPARGPMKESREGAGCGWIRPTAAEPGSAELCASATELGANLLHSIAVVAAHRSDFRASLGERRAVVV